MDKVPYFSGEHAGNSTDEFGGSCREWLKLVRKACRSSKFPAGISVHRAFIDWVDLKLQGQAREWVESQSEVAELLNADVSEKEDEERAKLLSEALILRFPDSIVPKEEQGMLDWTSLGELRQGPEESLRDYYGRVGNLLVCLGGTNKANQGKPYSLILQRVIDSFCSGLNNQRLEFDTRRALPRTVIEAYTLAAKFKHFWKNWGDRAPVTAPVNSLKPVASPGRADRPSTAQLSKVTNDEIGSQNIREGYPAHRTKECYDILPSLVQEIIKRGGKGLICFQCKEPNH